MRQLCLLIASALFVSVPAFADEKHTHHDHAALDLGNIGKASIATSCNAAAQTGIDRGLALIHSFWYAEAEKAFRRAAEADTTCGMAWWGVAMSNYHPIWAPPTPDEMKRGKEATEMARAAGAKTARENAFIEAISGFYTDAERLDHRTRAYGFEKAMAVVTANNPNDYEASIFYALSLLGTASPADKTYANQKRAADLLNRVLSQFPEHPGVAHYIIHSFDYPDLASLALPAARAYSKLAPGSPHALHMPSHIYVRLGLWDESISSNLASAEKARRYMEQKSAGSTAFDELHAVDYLVYAYLQQRRFEDAKRLVDLASRVTSLDDAANFAGAFAIAAAPARYALERRQWKEAASLPPLPDIVPWQKIPYAEANHHFARALGGARAGDLAVARSALARLGALRQALLDQKNTYWADQVEIQRLSAAAWLAYAEKKTEEALALARSAAELELKTEKHPVTPGAIVPARELLAELLLETGHATEALAEAELALATTPNRYNTLWLATSAAKKAKMSDKEKTYRGQMTALSNPKSSSTATIKVRR